MDRFEEMMVDVQERVRRSGKKLIALKVSETFLGHYKNSPSVKAGGPSGIVVKGVPVYIDNNVNDFALQLEERDDLR